MATTESMSPPSSDEGKKKGNNAKGGKHGGKKKDSDKKPVISIDEDKVHAEEPTSPHEMSRSAREGALQAAAALLNDEESVQRHIEEHRLRNEERRAARQAEMDAIAARMQETTKDGANGTTAAAEVPAAEEPVAPGVEEGKPPLPPMDPPLQQQPPLLPPQPQQQQQQPQQQQPQQPQAAKQGPERHPDFEVQLGISAAYLQQLHMGHGMTGGYHPAAAGHMQMPQQYHNWYNNGGHNAHPQYGMGMEAAAYGHHPQQGYWPQEMAVTSQEG